MQRYKSKRKRKTIKERIFTSKRTIVKKKIKKLLRVNLINSDIAVDDEIGKKTGRD